MNHALLYPYAVFLHVLGAMALMAFYGLEWACLLRLRLVSESRQVADALSPFKVGGRLIALSMPSLLLSGVYMAWAAWDWLAPWIVFGFAAMILLGFLGGRVTGRHIRAVIASDGAELAARLPAMWTSFVTRVSVLVGVIFLMCAKPGLAGSLAAMVLSLAAGALLARRVARPAAAAVT